MTGQNPSTLIMQVQLGFVSREGQGFVLFQPRPQQFWANSASYSVTTGSPTTAVKQLKGLAVHSPCLVFIHKMHQEKGEKCIRNFGSYGASGGLVIFRSHKRGEISSLAERPSFLPRRLH